MWLASKSPRRQEILRAADISFQLLDIQVEEDFPDDMAAEKVASFLAQKKAVEAITLVPADHTVLTADSVVILDNVIYGKAESREEAFEMIRVLSGRQHLVITGVCLMRGDQKLVFDDHTKVWLEPMTDDEIYFYIEKEKPFDKAGAYGIQDWIGWVKVSRIEGSFANVMGLPVHKVYQALQQW